MKQAKTNAGHQRNRTDKNRRRCLLCYARRGSTEPCWMLEVSRARTKENVRGLKPGGVRQVTGHKKKVEVAACLLWTFELEVRAGRDVDARAGPSWSSRPPLRGGAPPGRPSLAFTGFHWLSVTVSAWRTAGARCQALERATNHLCPLPTPTSTASTANTLQKTTLAEQTVLPSEEPLQTGLQAHSDDTCINVQSRDGRQQRL